MIRGFEDIILQHISALHQGEGGGGGSFNTDDIKNISYETNKIVITMKDDTVYRASVKADSEGRITRISINGHDYKARYDNNNLIGINEMNLDLSKYVSTNKNLPNGSVLRPFVESFNYKNIVKVSVN